MIRPVRQRPTREIVNDRYCQAGSAYVAAAAALPDAKDKAANLWLGTLRYLAGQDRLHAASSFDQLIATQLVTQAQMGEGWYRLGEAHRQALDLPAAAAAYREAIKYPTPFGYRARYQLAELAWKRGDVDDAEAALVQNLRLLRFDRDDEAQEKSLFALGQLYFKRSNYKEAAQHLEEGAGTFPQQSRVDQGPFRPGHLVSAVGGPEKRQRSLQDVFQSGNDSDLCPGKCPAPAARRRRVREIDAIAGQARKRRGISRPRTPAKCRFVRRSAVITAASTSNRCNCTNTLRNTSPICASANR